MKERRTMVYAGTINAKGNKRMHVYIKIEEGENDGRRLRFPERYAGDGAGWFAKPLGPCPVGGLCSADVETGDGGRKTYSNFNGYEGTWENREDRDEWQGRTRTNETTAKVRSDAAKNKYKDVDEIVDRLRGIYVSLGYANKGAFVAYVVSAMMNGRHAATKD